MKVLLIKPPTGGIYNNLKEITPEYPPLGLAYIAAFLERANHEVRIIDLSVEPLTKEGMILLVRRYSPGVIGLTANTPTTEKSYGIIADLRSHFPDIVYVLGGAHPTAMPEEALAYADIVVRGEGEETFLELVNSIDKKRVGKKWFDLPTISHIKGISFKHGGKVRHNPDRPFNMDLDSYPLPSRHLLKMERYRYFGAKKYPLTNIITSRGCPFRCTYCNKNISGHMFRARSAENVLKEIDYLVNEMGIRELHISDDTFTLDRKRVEEICAGLRKRKYDLAFFPHNGVRVNTVDYSLLKQMKEIGFYAMVYGVESGNQAILNNINKAITLDQARTAFRLAKKAGLETWGFFILGLPGETVKTAMDTINFAIELDPDVAKMHILVPYPGTPDYERLKGRLVIKNWSDYTLFNGPTFEPENMSRKQLHDLFKLAYRKFYFRPAPIFRTAIKSLKSPKTLVENLRAASSVLKISK